MENKHYPVLLNESIELLSINENGIYVDCTLGRAGHSIEIIKKLKNGKLFSFDQDKTAIESCKELESKYQKKFKIINSNFSNIKAMLTLNGIDTVDGILYDLGVSSPQFDVPERGFSYRFEGPLDMRMDIINNNKTAKIILNEYSEEELSNIIFTGGERKFARWIAKEIVLNRKVKTIESTLELVDIIKSALPQKVLKLPGHPAKKTFQALRVFVNDELNILEKSIHQSLEILKPGGRLVIITFQPSEEEIVKKIFKEKTFDSNKKFFDKLPTEYISTKKYELLIKKPIKASEKELLINPRSHSAKMWAIKKRG